MTAGGSHTSTTLAQRQLRLMRSKPSTITIGWYDAATFDLIRHAKWRDTFPSRGRLWPVQAISPCFLGKYTPPVCPWGRQPPLRGGQGFPLFTFLSSLFTQNEISPGGAGPSGEMRLMGRFTSYPSFSAAGRTAAGRCRWQPPPARPPVPAHSGCRR